MSEYQYKSWRPWHNPIGGPGDTTVYKLPKSEVEPIKFFDQLAFVGTSQFGIFVLETSEGLIMIESGEPTRECFNAITKGFDQLGYSLDDLKAVLVAHGHYDHFGCAGILRRLPNCKVYMTKDDYEYGSDIDFKRPEKTLMWEPDGYLDDGDEFVLGDTTVYCVHDKRNNYSGLSMIFKVTDSGKEHWAVLLGCTYTDTLNYDEYLASVEYVREKVNEFGCDVEIYSHGHMDSTRERLVVCRNIVNGVANPFVIGNDAVNRYLDWHEEIAIIQKKNGWKV